MNCPDVASLVPLYLTGELDAERSAAVASHLAACSPCARQIARTRRFDDRLRAEVLAEPMESRAIEKRVLEQIARRGRGRKTALLWATGIAAAATVVAGSAVVAAHKPPSLLAAAARDHRMEIVDRQARRWQTGFAPAEQLAASRGIDGTLVATIAGAGYQFREARLCRLDGFLFLHLVYTDRGKEFSVFLRKEQGGSVSGALRDTTAGKPIYTADAMNQHVAGFTDGALKALIVTDEPAEAALRIARTTAALL